MKGAVRLLGFLASVWVLVFLWTTPRGDRILSRVDKALFPDAITK